MLRPSFSKTYAADGYRYGISYRTRRTESGWDVQKWNGAEWVTVGTGNSYDHARTIAAQADRA